MDQIRTEVCICLLPPLFCGDPFLWKQITFLLRVEKSHRTSFTNHPAQANFCFCGYFSCVPLTSLPIKAACDGFLIPKLAQAAKRKLWPDSNRLIPQDLINFSPTHRVTMWISMIGLHVAIYCRESHSLPSFLCKLPYCHIPARTCIAMLTASVENRDSCPRC